MSTYFEPASAVSHMSGVTLAEITSQEGEDFEDARTKLIERVRLVPSWSWMLPWIETTYEAHQKRHDLLQIVNETRQD